MTASMLRAFEPTKDSLLDARDSLMDARDSLLDHLPDPAKIDLPSLERLGRRADETVDRARGRSRRPLWAWVLGAVVVGGIALVATSLVMTWNRNRTETWRDDALDGLDRMSEDDALPGSDLGATADLSPVTGATTGLTAVEGSLLSYDPVEGRDS